MSKYAPGQVWTYKTRKGEEDSRLTVCQVDVDDELGTIIHVFISNVAIKCDDAPDGLVKNIHHSPYSEAAIDESVLELEAEDVELPDFRDGYRQWREVFEKEEAGIFSLVVSDGVDVMEEAMQRQG